MIPTLVIVVLTGPELFQKNKGGFYGKNKRNKDIQNTASLV